MGDGGSETIMDAAQERWCFELNGDEGRKRAQTCRSGGACQRGQPVSFERCTLDFQERRDIQGHKNDVDVGGGGRRREGKGGAGEGWTPMEGEKHSFVHRDRQTRNQRESPACKLKQPNLFA